MQETSQEASAAAACGCWVDPVIEVFKRDVDRTFAREALKMTPGDRLMNLHLPCASGRGTQAGGSGRKAQR